MPNSPENVSPADVEGSIEEDAVAMAAAETEEMEETDATAKVTVGIATEDTTMIVEATEEVTEEVVDTETAEEEAVEASAEIVEEEAVEASAETVEVSEEEIPEDTVEATAVAKDKIEDSEVTAAETAEASAIVVAEVVSTVADAVRKC